MNPNTNVEFTEGSGKDFTGIKVAANTRHIRNKAPFNAFKASFQGIFLKKEPINKASQTPMTGRSKNKLATIAATKIIITINNFPKSSLILFEINI